MEELLSAVSAELRPIRDFLELDVPHQASDVIARLHSVAQVVHRDYSGETARFRARIPPHLRAEFAPYMVNGHENGADGHDSDRTKPAPTGVKVS